MNNILKIKVSRENPWTRSEATGLRIQGANSSPENLKAICELKLWIQVADSSHLEIDLRVNSRAHLYRSGPRIYDQC